MWALSTLCCGEGVSPQVQDVTPLQAVLERGLSWVQDTPQEGIVPLSITSSPEHTAGPPPWGSPRVQGNGSSPRLVLVLGCLGVAERLLVWFILD